MTVLCQQITAVRSVRKPNLVIQRFTRVGRTWQLQSLPLLESNSSSAILVLCLSYKPNAHTQSPLFLIKAHSSHVLGIDAKRSIPQRSESLPSPPDVGHQYHSGAESGVSTSWM